MPGIYAGATPKYLTRIRDENGTQLDPSDVNDIIEVRIWIYNSITGTEVAKFYLNTPPNPIGTWRAAETFEVAPGDVRVRFYLTSSETRTAEVNKNEIQIEVTVPDTDLPNDQRIIIKKGRFVDILPAKS